MVYKHWARPTRILETQSFFVPLKLFYQVFWLSGHVNIITAPDRRALLVVASLELNFGISSGLYYFLVIYDSIYMYGSPFPISLSTICDQSVSGQSFTSIKEIGYLSAQSLILCALCIENWRG